MGFVSENLHEPLLISWRDEEVHGVGAGGLQHLPCDECALRRGCFSPIATSHRRIPDPFAFGVKEEVGISRRSGPVIARELTVELTRSPTCVAKCNQCFLRAGLATDVAKYLPARGDSGELLHSDGVGAIVVRAVYDQADSRLHRPSREDLHVTFGRNVALAQKAKKLRQRMLPEWPIYCDTERAVLAVLHHENNRAAKAG